MKFILFACLCLLLFVLYIRYVESKAVFYPDPHIQVTPQDLGLEYEDVYFAAEDGVLLHGWFLRSPGARSTMIFCHGNAGNIGGRVLKLKYFYEMGVNVFIFDYRGYGKSQGVPSEAGLYKDAQAAYDYLTRREDIDTASLFVYGASLGGVVAVDLALRRPLACLIVDSSFSSAKDVAKKILPIAPGFLLRTKMDSASKIRHIQIPKLLLHSKEDEIIPYFLGEKLFQAAQPPKSFVETKGGHNLGYEQYKDQFVNAIRDFLKEHNLI